MTMLAQFAATGGGIPAYIEEVFSTYLWTGTGSARSISNGIDLDGEGGLVWIKSRGSLQNILFDTERGASQALQSNDSSAQQVYSPDTLTSFNSDGFTLSTSILANSSSYTYASWAFRKKSKFFDVVTYTGNGTSQNIAHDLGSTPGCVIVKGYSGGSDDWYVWHRGLSSSTQSFMILDSTGVASTSATYWNNTAPTSTEFSVGAATATNANGTPYVAYVFAHDAGGFGQSGSENVISCGSYTGNGSAASGPTVTLGYEPQWLMIKAAGDLQGWRIYDNLRGLPISGDVNYTSANSTAAEAGLSNGIAVSATGFKIGSADDSVNKNTINYIYIAIRRGPMKAPTDGTKVFKSQLRVGTGAVTTLTGIGFPPDLVIGTDPQKSLVSGTYVFDRMRGPLLAFDTTAAGAQSSYTQTLTGFDAMDGTIVGADVNGWWNFSGKNYINWNFRRAPSFFDEVRWTGTGSATTVTHNLGVAPELMIVKKRSATSDWNTFHSFGVSTFGYQYLNTVSANATLSYGSSYIPSAPTSSVFAVGTNTQVNASAATYVAYLFATCAGVSKVGSYTGTGTTKQIDCGFAAGARFVLIKRTDSTGDWYVWDTVRGMVAGNDPYLLLNSTAAEVTSTDYVDTYAAGFELSSTAPAALNASGGSYIFLAIA